MPISPYIRSLRERIGQDILLLPAVSAVIRDDDGRILLARSQGDEQWALVGGGIEPNGDRCAYVTAAYECRLNSSLLTLEADELRDAAWFTPAEILKLETQPYVARILADAGVPIG